jgi:hypothetical protein
MYKYDDNDRQSNIKINISYSEAEKAVLKMKELIDKFIVIFNDIDNDKNSWKHVLQAWNNGDYLKYDGKLNGFFWQTLPINKDATSEFKQIFRPTEFTNEMNSEAFDEYLNKAEKTDAAVSFWNRAKNTLLIVPTPQKGKNYAHLAEFMKNASPLKQKKFWKFVAKTIETELKELKKDDILYVSTHGHGVPYLHIRLEINKPKYFDPEKLYPHKMEFYKFE